MYIHKDPNCLQDHTKKTIQKWKNFYSQMTHLYPLKDILITNNILLSLKSQNKKNYHLLTICTSSNVQPSWMQLETLPTCVIPADNEQNKNIGHRLAKVNQAIEDSQAWLNLRQ